MRKKAQAAMEFLMTYGWAILVVLAAIGALAYLGILNPSNWTEGSCQMQGAFRCEDVVIGETSGNLSMIILSSVDATINDATITDQEGSVADCGLSGEDMTITTGNVVNALNDSQSSGRRNLVVIDCPGTLTEGDRYSADIVISYRASSGLTKTVTGTIQNIKVQP